MTNMNAMKTLFYKIGIEYEEVLDTIPRYVLTSANVKMNVLRIGSGTGYVDFYTEFYFDENGKFLEHGVWE